MNKEQAIQLQPLSPPGKSSTKLKYAFFIFVNPTSGGNKAAVLTKLDIEKLVFSTFNPNGGDVEVNFYSLKDPISRNRGLRCLKEAERQDNANIRVIVGGGDGTIMWVIEEMIKTGLSFEKCPIGCIPFGTGNDFSRVLGWGGEEPSVLIGTHLNNLKGLITKWVNAVPQDFDIWDITFEVHEEGGIRRIHKEDGKKFEKRYISEKDASTGEDKKVLTFTKKMCNYYSFGIDARIGYGFDKSRTTSRGLNKMVYCWEGFKKMFTNTFKVNSLIHRIQSYKAPERDIETNQNGVEVDFTGQDFILYPSNHGEKSLQSGTVIKGDPSVFLCLNIPSYMGGASNPWASSKGKLGVTDHAKKTLVDFPDQNFGDSKLEMISFSGPGSLAMERFIHGQGRRVGQVKGPFAFNFKRNNDVSKPLSTYMQIDGEYFQLLAPKNVQINLAKSLPNGKVKVLVNSAKKN